MKALLSAFADLLETREATIGQAAPSLLRKLAGGRLPEITESTEPPQAIQAHLPGLLESPGGGTIGRCLAEVARMGDRLAWSNSFRSHMPFVEIVGPTGMLPHDELRTGLFLMPPEIHYANHAHSADEVYVVLDGTGWWSLNHGPFVQKNPGDVIEIPSFTHHAMDTKARPALMLWSWTGDLRWETYRFIEPE